MQSNEKHSLEEIKVKLAIATLISLFISTICFSNEE